MITDFRRSFRDFQMRARTDHRSPLVQKATRAKEWASHGVILLAGFEMRYRPIGSRDAIVGQL